MKTTNLLFILCLSICAALSVYAGVPRDEMLRDIQISMLMRLSPPGFQAQYVRFMERYQAAVNSGLPIAEELVERHRVFTEARQRQEQRAHQAQLARPLQATLAESESSVAQLQAHSTRLSNVIAQHPEENMIDHLLNDRLSVFQRILFTGLAANAVSLPSSSSSSAQASLVSFEPNTECAICLMPIESAASAYALRCRHIFHTECDNALRAAEMQNHKNMHLCPLCRATEPLAR